MPDLSTAGRAPCDQAASSELMILKPLRRAKSRSAVELVDAVMLAKRRDARPWARGHVTRLRSDASQLPARADSMPQLSMLRQGLSPSRPPSVTSGRSSEPKMSSGFRASPAIARAAKPVLL
jgi:hypothetical protein